MVGGFVLCEGDVAELAVQPSLVEPVHVRLYLSPAVLAWLGTLVAGGGGYFGFVLQR